MKNPLRTSSTQLFSLAVTTVLCSYTLLNSSISQAGVLWVDNERESVAIPLESPALGIARAKLYLAKGDSERAVLALRKVVAKYPTAAEAHELMAGIYREQGKTELASLHDKLARQG
jgi:Tfp pilus assembly protein PilF